MCVASETDKIMMPNNGIESPATDEANSIGTVEGNGRLKKGPWTSAEDAILVEYVVTITNHGKGGNWNAVQRHTGLARCGKSCRLRWKNHLRPDLIKGPFTPEEEHLIIELHAKMGNKWAQMAAEMPGRTDNEIKNYWNTRIKRRQRAGLSIYPPEICLQALNENQQKDNISALSSGDAHCRDAMPVNNFEIPAVQFKSLELNQHVYPPPFLDIPTSGFVLHGLHSPYPNKSVLSTMHPHKRLRGPESIFPGSSATMSNTVPDGSQYEIGSYVQNAQPFIYSAAYDHNSTFNHPLSSNVLAGSHAVINGNPSSSEPTWAMKQELPSLQTQAENWGSPSSPLPPLVSVDTLTPAEHNPSFQLSSQTMQHPSNSSDLLSSHASSIGFSLMDVSSQLIHETGWERYGELTSPIGHSSSSMFSECNGEPEAVGAITELKTTQPCGFQRDMATTRVRRQTRCSACQICCLPRIVLVLRKSITLVVDDLSRDKSSNIIRSYPCAWFHFLRFYVDHLIIWTKNTSLKSLGVPFPSSMANLSMN